MFSAIYDMHTCIDRWECGCRRLGGSCVTDGPGMSDLQEWAVRKLVTHPTFIHFHNACKSHVVWRNEAWSGLLRLDQRDEVRGVRTCMGELVFGFLSFFLLFHSFVM